MFKKITAAACLVSSAMADLNKDFSSYLHGEKEMNYQIFDKMWTAYGNEYTSFKQNSGFSESSRMNQFQLTIEDIIAHNSDPASTYMKGINEFSDMTNEEFVAHYNIKMNDGVSEPQHCSATNKRMSVAKHSLDRDGAWDWRKHNGVSPVKNQGKCGSCWTFSTVGCLEAHAMIKYDGAFDSLSEQQLVDCAGDYDNHGCNGGLPSHAFEYIKHAGGISTEKDYPYFATDRNCTVKQDTFAL